MISFLQEVARGTAERIGRETPLIRAIRPGYEALLDTFTAGKGVPWSINGAMFRIDPRERHHFCHNYDPTVANVLRERVRPGAVCFDVGANVGIYVLQFAHWSSPNGKVIAFEPNPAARGILDQHVRLNGIADRVEIVPCAVGAENGRATLFAAAADGMSRLGEPNRALAGQASAVPVTVVTLDKYCEETGVRPDILLIDIEGFEIAALAGASGLIREQDHDLLIIVEMHAGAWGTAGTTRAIAEKLFADLRLRAVPLTGQRDPLEEYGQVLLERY